jgi:anaerobic ribonucleoside-triphosphate reductase activating protein
MRDISAQASFSFLLSPFYLISLPMLKYLTYDIVFQEFPDEVTLAVNLSLCPNRCPGCHSSILLGDVGEPLDADVLIKLADKYKGEITCVALMGGDNDPTAVGQVLAAVKQHYGGSLKTGWYSGRQELPADFNPAAFDYVKVGPYREALGALRDRTTNQRFYRVEADGSLTDMTHRFWR